MQGSNRCWSGINDQPIFIPAWYWYMRFDTENWADIWRVYYAWYIDWYWPQVWDWVLSWYIPDLGHTRLVWYLISLLIPGLIPFYLRLIEINAIGFDPRYNSQPKRGGVWGGEGIGGSENDDKIKPHYCGWPPSPPTSPKQGHPFVLEFLSHNKKQFFFFGGQFFSVVAKVMMIHWEDLAKSFLL